jgi:hypothetical protein
MAQAIPLRERVRDGGERWERSQQYFGKFTPDADAEIEASAKKYGIDPAFLKAIITAESCGDWESNNRVVDVGFGSPVLPYAGISVISADAHGIDFNAIKGNRAAQIDACALILHHHYQDIVNHQVARMWFHGDWEQDGLTSGYPDSMIGKIRGWAKQLRRNRRG